MVDVQGSSPGKAMVLPEDRQSGSPSVVVSPANRAIAFNAVAQLLSGKGIGLINRAKIGVVNGNQLEKQYPTRWIDIATARRELQGCLARPAEDLGAENGREYFLIRLNCSRPIAGWNRVYLGVGVQGASTKIIYLNEGAPMGAGFARNKNG
ncbi:hypothetical protein [Sphingomonas sp.]|uniref:hypothetical protein n=1 Tax=Sphingomonas sp. TaxID=28214 RepID=UPI0025DAF1AC|nr:hypothetical protein [Sphingomonas sp.]